METWQLAALEGIRKTLAEYVIFTDSGRSREFAALFAEDGVFVLPSGHALTGPQAIVGFLDAQAELFQFQPAMAPPEPGYLRHQITTQNIDVLNENAATVEAYFMTCTSKGLDHWGRWLDELQREPDGRWRFKKRVVLTEASYPDSWYAGVFSKAAG